jgi:predicted transglutaminase-like cysteine proteinase
VTSHHHTFALSTGQKEFVISRSALWLPLLYLTLTPKPAPEQALPPSYLQEALSQYDAAGRERLQDFQALIEEGRTESDWERLHLANDFANRHIRYRADLEHWGKNDYWATPLETLGTGAGDCEDYAISKYFSLRAMGVADEKLRLMYVRALSRNEPHMVLIYFETPDAYPLVLDNMDGQIRSARDRSDLKPIYSFNASGLWLAKASGLGKKVNNGRGNSQWTAVLDKIEQGQ